MKTQVASLLFSFSVLSLAGLSGCAADAVSAQDDSEEEVVAESEDALSGVSNYGYFIVTHRDFRKCVSPLCGGFFVKRVNEATTTCADGKKQSECYVSAITFGGMGLSAREEQEFRAAVEAGHGLIKARTYKKKWNGIQLGTLKASEGWMSATSSVDGTFDGSFYRAADNGIRCITAPCPSTSAFLLNAKDSWNVIAVHLDNTQNPADQDTIARAQNAIGTPEGILVAGGVAIPKCIPGSKCGPFVTASDFYLKYTHTEGKSCGGHVMGPPMVCNAGQYCAWTPENMCGAFDASGACSYKPEVCNKLYAPVCACDGNTYSNDCMAAAAGYSVSSQGACAK
jgi:hypothetical protein